MLLKRRDFFLPTLFVWWRFFHAGAHRGVLLDDLAACDVLPPAQRARCHQSRRSVIIDKRRSQRHPSGRPGHQLPLRPREAPMDFTERSTSTTQQSAPMSSRVATRSSRNRRVSTTSDPTPHALCTVAYIPTMRHSDISSLHQTTQYR